MVVASVLGLAAITCFAASSVVLVRVDARERRLPDRLVAPASAAVLVLIVATAVASGAERTPFAALRGGTGPWLAETLVPAAAVFALFLVLAVLRPGALGGGDVKVAPVVAGVLGFAGGWPLVALGVMLGFGLAGGWAMVRQWARGRPRSDAFAFAPSLFGGAWIALLVASCVA